LAVFGSPAPVVDCVTLPVGVTGVVGAGFCGAGADPPPVGTLSTYSFGAEVGSVVSGGGVVSVGVVAVGVVCVGVVCVVCAGAVCAGVVSVVVCPYAGPAQARMLRLTAAARTARGVGASVM
jgi:hypothetical protein